MGINKKIAIVILAGLAAAYGVFFFVLKYSINSSLLDFEHGIAEKNIGLVQRIFEEKTEEIEKSANEYAARSSSYDYLFDGRGDFFENNAGDNIFEHAAINYLGLFDLFGQVKASKYYDLNQHIEKEVPKSLADFIFENSQLLCGSNGSCGTTGYAMVADELVLITIRPVLFPGGSGEMIGSLVLIREVKGDFIDDLSSLLNVPIAISKVNSEELELFNEKLAKDHEHQLVIRENKNQFEGMFFIHDIFGQHPMKVVTATSRQINSLLFKQGAIISLSVLLAYLLIIFSIMIIIRKTVVSRITSFAKQVENLKENKEYNLNIRIDGKDEIAGLASSVNRLLNRIFESQQELYNVLKGVEKDKKYAEETRLATLNILEDIAESEANYRLANEEMKKSKKELEVLNSLSEKLVKELNIDDSITILNDHLRQMMRYRTAIYLVMSPSDEGGASFMAFLNEEISESTLARLKANISEEIGNLNNQAAHAALKIVKNINPRVLGKGLDNYKGNDLKKSIVISLTPGNNFQGAILFEVDNDEFWGKEKMIRAMIANFSLSMERLQALVSVQHSKTVSLVESLNDGIVVFNPSKDMILVNPAVRSYIGLSKEGMYLDSIDGIFEGAGVGEKIEQALIFGTMSRVDEAQIINRYYELLITPIKERDNKISGAALIIHDITYLKEIEIMKNEFVSIASHQLRTPLTAIKLFTEMLVSGEMGKLKKDQKEYLDNIYQSTERMTRLVNDLLNITRIESARLRIDPQPTLISKLVNNIVEEVNPLASLKGVRLIMKDTVKNNKEIMVDENLFRQVVHNLVVNAIRYTAVNNGEVEVNLSDHGSDNVIISVRDNGIGIPQSAKARMFEKFFRADNAVKAETEGTGLGLYVCKKVVELSKGQIWFDSEEGKGTTFYVTLPKSGVKPRKGERGLIIS